MENKKEIASGSATLMVMMIMTILVIIGTTALRTATMLHDLAMQRIQTQRQLRSSHALVQYGIAYCRVIDDVKKKEKEYTYTFERWPHHTSEYSGKIVIVPEKQRYEVKTQLFKGEHELAKASCFVCKEQSRWKIALFSA